MADGQPMKASAASWLRISAHGALTSSLLAASTGAYLVALFDLSGPAWRTFFGIVAVVFVPLFGAISTLHRRQSGPMLDLIERGCSSPDPERAALEYRVTMRFPHRCAAWSAGAWWIGATLVIGSAWLAIPEFGRSEALASGACCLGASIVYALIAYLDNQRLIRSTQQMAAIHLPVEVRAAQLLRVPVGVKLGLSFATAGVVPVALAAVLVASSAGDGRNLGGELVAVACVAGAGAAWLAWLFGRSLTRNLDDLRDCVEGLARGDLRVPVLVESDDEVGELARSCATLASELVEAVQHMVSTAGRIERATGSAEGVGEQVSEASRGQREIVRSTAVALDGIAKEARGIAQRSEELEAVVESSSTATMELRASGQELQEISNSLFERIDQAVSAIGQISASALEISERIRNLANSAEEAHDATHRLATSATEIDRDAGETGRLAATVVEASEKGRSQVRRSEGGMLRIQEAVGAGVDSIDRLREDVTRIREVVDLIDEVAAETHLLSLNASIIAAQSGEHGRGFAVVAGEIKGLARRVTERTQEITGIIVSVETGTSSAADAMVESRTAVDQGLLLSIDAGRALESIEKAAHESGRRVQEILGSIRAQGSSTLQMRTLMEDVAHEANSIEASVTQQTNSHQEVLSAATSIRDVAELVHRSAAEQAKGAETILGGVASVEDTVRSIHEAMGSQASACASSLTLMQQLRERADENQAAAAHLGSSLGSLRKEAETLRQQVADFVMREQG